MKKSIFLFFAAILYAMSISANMVYLKPNGDWSGANAKFYVWSWGGSTDLGGQMTYVGLGLYGYEIGNNTTCLFTRNAPASSGLWDQEWNRISDQTINTTKPCCQVTDWSAGEWIAVPTAHIAGQEALTGFDWKPEQNEMEKQPNGTWTLTKTIESIAQDEYEYKVTDGSWGWSLGNGSDNAKLDIPATGKYEVTFTYTPSTETVSATATPIYSITVNAGEGGNATGSGECKNGEYVTIDATPETNYEFVNWTIVNGTGSFESNTTASTKFYATSDATIQANFRSTLTYSLTTSFGEGIASVTGATNPVTLGESYAISATPKTGYTFKTWTANPAENAEFETATNANTNVKVLNGSVDVIASATEILSTLTTANAYSEGDAGLAIPTATVSEIGVVTTANVTATAACVGYAFANWTLSNCERIDGGAENATTITVKSIGNGAAATITANYTKVPTATVYFVNNASWSTINVYAWNNDGKNNGSWPGVEITANKESEPIGTYDVYSYTVNQGSYTNLIFSGSEQTEDLVWADDKYYYMGAAKNYAGGTKEEVASAIGAIVYYDYYIAGNMNGWAENAEFGMTDENADGIYETKLTLSNEAEFKVKKKGEDSWYGFEAIEGRYEETSSNGGNIKLTLGADTEVTVKFNSETKKITFEGLTPDVAPLTYTVIVPPGTEKCYIAGNMNGWAFQEMEAVTGETDKFTITIVGAKETDEYKYACQADWAYAEVREADENGNSNRKAWTALDEVTAWGKPVVYTYYLMGIEGDWTTGIKMEVNTDAENEVMLTCQPVNGEVKIKRVGDDESEYWYGGKSLKEEAGNLGTNTSTDGGDGNILLEEGIYNFYFNTADGKLWIAAATDCGPATITLTTGNNDDVIEANIGKTVNVVIERSFTANDGFYTLCVPFNMPASVIGKAYSLGTITKHVTDESIDIELEETYELSAGVPYLVLPKANMSELVVENVTIQSDPASGQNITKSELNVQIFFEGFYSTPAAPDNQTNGSTQYYVGEHGYLYNGVVDIHGLSGLFTITDANGEEIKNVRARVVTHEEVETGFENITNGENTTIKLIENGQLIIIRGGEKFNAQGQKL